MNNDKMTVASTPGGALALRGHISRKDAIEHLRAHYLHQAKQASDVLDAIRLGNVSVVHQRGQWTARDRREVHDDA